MDSLTSEQVRDSFHYLFRAELPALKQLVRSLPPNPLVVNIGAGSGTSGLAILESRPDVTLVTVDIENENSPLGSLDSERGVMERAGYDHLRGTRWFQIHGDSKQVGRHWDLAQFAIANFGLVVVNYVAMVFVDGGHQYDECRGDIEAWWPHLAPGGVMAVHDYNKEQIPPTADGPHWKAWPGVNRAVDEMLRSRYEPLVYVDSLIAFRKP